MNLPDNLLKHYANSEIVTMEGALWAGTGSLPFPLFIITAHNPFSMKTSSINDALHKCLQTFLQAHFPEAQWEEVVGQSKDGQWKEISLAISGLSEEQAIAIGRHFAQWAIFRLDDNGLVVVACS